MLWFKKQAKNTKQDANAPALQDEIIPATLSINLDKKIFKAKFAALLENVNEHKGLEPLVAALNAKHTLFEKALSEDNLANLSYEDFLILLDTIFPARKKFTDIKDLLTIETLRQALIELIHGKAPLTDRMATFQALLPKPDKKDKEAQKKYRAIRDLGAELLHFYHPDKYPLMTRWVWDSSVEAGAMREFVQNSHLLNEVPLDTSPETYEAVRLWIAECLNEEGYYRDVALLADLILAQSYRDYSQSLTLSVGMIQAEFGGKQDPLDLILKLLGIDSKKK